MKQFLKMLKHRCDLLPPRYKKIKSKPMTDKLIESAELREHPYMMYDTRGLSLLILKTGSKSWKYRYTFNANPKQIALGYYPDMSIESARVARDNYRDMVKAGIDPNGNH